MNPFLEGLYDDLVELEHLLRENGANKAIQERALAARNAITWLQERLDEKS